MTSENSGSEAIAASQATGGCRRKTVITLEIEHEKPIEGLADKVAARAYTIDGVRDTTVIALES